MLNRLHPRWRTVLALAVAVIVACPLSPLRADDLDIYTNPVVLSTQAPITALALDLGVANADQVLCNNVLLSTDQNCVNIRAVVSLNELVTLLGVPLSVVAGLNPAALLSDLTSGVRTILAVPIAALAPLSLTGRQVQILGIQQILEALVNSRVTILLNHANRGGTGNQPCAFADKSSLTGGLRRDTVACSNGAYIFAGLTNLADPLQLTALLARVVTALLPVPPLLTAPAGSATAPNGSIAPPYQTKEIYAELVKYLRGDAMFNGHLGWYDYGNTVPNRNLNVSLPLLSWDTSVETPDGLNYQSGLAAYPQACTINLLHVQLTQAAQQDDSDTDLIALYPNVSTDSNGVVSLPSLVDTAATDGFSYGGGNRRLINSSFVVQDNLFTAGDLSDLSKIANAGYNVSSYTGALGLLGRGQSIASSLVKTLAVDANISSFSYSTQRSSATGLAGSAYLPVFRPTKDQTPNWPGDIKRLNLTVDNTGLPLLSDAKGNPAIAGDGRILTSALTVWTDPTKLGTNVGADGRKADLGGAGQKIPGYQFGGGGNPGRSNPPAIAASTRTIFYDSYTGTGGTALKALNPDDAGVRAELLIATGATAYNDPASLCASSCNANYGLCSAACSATKTASDTLCGTGYGTCQTACSTTNASCGLTCGSSNTACTALCSTNNTACSGGCSSAQTACLAPCNTTAALCGTACTANFTTASTLCTTNATACTASCAASYTTATVACNLLLGSARTSCLATASSNQTSCNNSCTATASSCNAAAASSRSSCNSSCTSTQASCSASCNNTYNSCQSGCGTTLSNCNNTCNASQTSCNSSCGDTLASCNSGCASSQSNCLASSANALSSCNSQCGSSLNSCVSMCPPNYSRTADTVTGELLLYARGFDVGTSSAPKGSGPTNNPAAIGTANSTAVTGRSWLMGAALHSRPLAIDYGSLGTYVVFGTADGLLHMVNDSNDASASGKGIEQWAFMPQAVMGALPVLRDNQSGATLPYGFDGSPVALVRAAAKSGDPPQRVLLFAGLRRGGTGYYALDVTTPTSPKLLWKIGTDGLRMGGGNGIVAGSATSYAQLGLSFPTPKLAKLRVNGADHFVLVVGGGYNGGRNAAGGKIGKDLNNSRATAPLSQVGQDDSDRGNGLYVIDAETGNLLWRAARTGGTVNNPLMVDSFAADATVLDTDNDGYLDRVYIGDTGGRLWRGDFVGDNPANWGFGPLVSIGRHGSSANGITDDRRIFFAPDYVPVRSKKTGYDIILFGTGDREDPLNTATRNYMYAYVDPNILSGVSASATSESALAQHTAFTDQTSTCTDTTCADVVTIPPGYRLQLPRNGEKLFSAPVTLSGISSFSTYVPVDPLASSTALCVPSEGAGRVYSIYLRKGTATPYNRLIASGRDGALAAPGLPGDVSAISGGAQGVGNQTWRLLPLPSYRTSWSERLGEDEKPLQ
jgi:Neisseria PilC beta-propeller domain